MLTKGNLPNGIAALKALVLSQQDTIAAQDVTIADKNSTIADKNSTIAEKNITIADTQAVVDTKTILVAALEKLVAGYKHALFGARSEKADPDTFQLAFEDLETGIEAIHAENEASGDIGETVKPAPKRKANRGHLPRHLARIEEIIAPESTTCDCGCQRHVIGEDVSERLHIVPAQFSVIVTRRPKYACRVCENGIIQVKAPASLIPSGMATEATVAHIIVSKYADHLPLYRQSQIFARQGVNLDRSTLASWVGRAAFALRPVFDALITDLKGSSKLFMDETTAPVLDPGKRKTKRGYFWALARDDRPWNKAGNPSDTTAPPGVAFTYADTRSGKIAHTILKDFKGILQVDGYAGYNKVLYRAGGGVQLAYCWAHARRKLFEISRTDRPTPIADEGVAKIAKLYRLEKEIRGTSRADRLAQRQEFAQPIIDDLKFWLDTNRSKVSAKSPLGVALGYINKHWNGLCLFLDDGRVELDNNTVERTIRPIALNRKNALFAGHDEGARNWALIASLIETCKLNNVNPHAYLTTTLKALISDDKVKDMNTLLPWNFNSNP
jgi:transposase